MSSTDQVKPLISLGFFESVHATEQRNAWKTTTEVATSYYYQYSHRIERTLRDLILRIVSDKRSKQVPKILIHCFFYLNKIYVLSRSKS